MEKHTSGIVLAVVFALIAVFMTGWALANYLRARKLWETPVHQWPPEDQVQISEERSAADVADSYYGGVTVVGAAAVFFWVLLIVVVRYLIINW